MEVLTRILLKWSRKQLLKLNTPILVYHSILGIFDVRRGGGGVILEGVDERIGAAAQHSPSAKHSQPTAAMAP